MDDIKTFCSNPLPAPLLSAIPETNHFDAIVINDKTYDIMLRIEKKMNELPAMGYDGLRKIWIETLRGKIEDWMTFEEFNDDGEWTHEDYVNNWKALFPDDIIWMEISTQRYQDSLTLFISDGEHRATFITNKPNLSDEGKFKDESREDLSKALKPLAEYVEKVIDKIKINEKSYVKYLEQNLPFRKREGKILRKKYDEIVPQHKITVDGEEEFRQILKEQLTTTDFSVCSKSEMTIRRYLHIWAIAYKGQLRNPEKLATKTDEEIFRITHDLNGEYDMDSPEDFDKWVCESARHYHGFDIVYARVSLYISEYYSDNIVYDLSASGLGYLNELSRIAKAMHDNIIPFRIQCAERILEILNGEDYIEIAPGHGSWSFYHIKESIPEIDDEELSQEQYDRLIPAIEWDNMEIKPFQQ